jgi:hypothetical protein
MTDAEVLTIAKEYGGIAIIDDEEYSPILIVELAAFKLLEEMLFNDSIVD